MFFDMNAIKWTVAAILVVIAVCILDLHCSNRRDENAPSAPSAMSRVKSEMNAGKREYASMRADQLEEQLRDLRLMAKRLVREGKDADARRVILTIQEMERDVKRLRERSGDD
jgi:hypothetical protein